MLEIDDDYFINSLDDLEAKRTILILCYISGNLNENQFNKSEIMTNIIKDVFNE